MRIEGETSWPLLGEFDAARTALVIIDMQVDFCAPGGWVDQLGEGIGNTREPIETIAAVLDAARKSGMTIVHTREGHRPDLSDLNPNKRWRTRAHGLGIGDTGKNGRVLTRGEPGHQIIPEVAPLAGEIILDKPGKSSFHATDFDQLLRARGIEALIVTGVTTDCCVQATIRDGADLGYDCLLVSDACGAVERPNHDGMIGILLAMGGRWGAVASSAEILALTGAGAAS